MNASKIVNFGYQPLDCAVRENDALAFVREMIADGCLPLDAQEVDGVVPGITVHRASDVYIGRYPVGSDAEHVVMACTPAVMDSWDAGVHDGLRDGPGSRIIRKPMRYLFRVTLSDDEIAALRNAAIRTWLSWPAACVGPGLTPLATSSPIE